MREIAGDQDLVQGLCAQVVLEYVEDFPAMLKAALASPREVAQCALVEQGGRADALQRAQVGIR
jgi:hypothetical protein